MDYWDFTETGHFTQADLREKKNQRFIDRRVAAQVLPSTSPLP
jgi:hypothetical protein